MPIGVLNAYAGALSRLQAEELLAAQQTALIGHSGRFDERTVRSIQRDLERMANGGRRRWKKASAASLAAMGISVERVAVPPKPE